MRSGRRFAGVLAIVAALAGPLVGRTDAHSGLRFSSPLDGATLGAGPTQIQLTFLEKPEITLSTIRVVDTEGRAYHADRPEIVDNDPLSIVVRLRPLGRGVYTVHWRVVSAVDGHASSGAYVFGVLVDPSSAARAITSAEANVSVVEGTARTIFLMGLVIALGAAAARLCGFGSGDELRPAVIGWTLSIAGLALLAVAQAQVSNTGLLALSRTSIGRALLWRACALGVMGVSLGFAARALRLRATTSPWLGGVAITALAAIGAHAAAGHAGAGRWLGAPTIAIHSLHFIAIAVWLGGLAAMFGGLKGAPSNEQARRVGKFSTLAGLGLATVATTGVIRTVQEVDRWTDLTATAYGRVVLAKLGLLVAIAGLGALNRWRNVPIVASDLRPLRRIAGIELALAAMAMTAAGFLGTLAPPAGARSIAGITASGSDFGTTVRARLAAASDQPGPNRFELAIDDYDSKAPIVADRVSLRFTPLDDPGVDSTTLALTRSPDGSYAGTGANLSFDGRWRVNVLVETLGSSVDVPLEIETRSQPQFLSVLRPPGQSPSYTIQVAGIGHVRITPDPERPGSSQLQITCFNGILEVLPVENIIVTSGEGSSVRQLSVRRQDRNHFVADAELHVGANRIAVIARTTDGTRLRAATPIVVGNSPN